MDRRKFLHACAAGAAAAAAGVELNGLLAPSGAANAAAGAEAPAAAAPAAGVREGDMIYRMLGKTGQKVSAIGLGGFHAGKHAEEADSIRLIRSAIDRGITFMDNCWDYHDGGSEVRMGKALRDGYRKKVFLMTKIDGRTKKAAAEQIDQCLQRLQTDCIDLMQHHEILRMEDPDRIFAEGGAMEAVVAAQKAGKIRFIGFTGHKDPLVHLRMLEVASEHDFHFDTLQMPLNVLDAHFRSFGAKVVPVAVKQQMGILGMKPLASGNLMKTNTVTAVEALHFALNLPTSVVINGIESAENLDQAFEATRTFKPMTEPEVAALLAKTAQVAAKGRFEPFKTSDLYDGTAHNPKWLG